MSACASLASARQGGLLLQRARTADGIYVNHPSMSRTLVDIELPRRVRGPDGKVANRQGGQLARWSGQYGPALPAFQRYARRTVRSEHDRPAGAIPAQPVDPEERRAAVGVVVVHEDIPSASVITASCPGPWIAP